MSGLHPTHLKESECQLNVATRTEGEPSPDRKMSKHTPKPEQDTKLGEGKTQVHENKSLLKDLTKASTN